MVKKFKNYLVRDNMMGLDIIGWLDVVWMSHMVSCVMSQGNNVMSSMMDRSMNSMMDSVMDRDRNCMMDSMMDGSSMMDSVMDWGRDGMMDSVMNRGRNCMDTMMDSMMERGRDGMDGVMNGGGGYWLIVHRSHGGGASIQSRVN